MEALLASGTEALTEVPQDAAANGSWVIEFTTLTAQPDVHPILCGQLAGLRGVKAAVDPGQGPVPRAAQLLAGCQRPAGETTGRRRQAQACRQVPCS
jgi:hypothetical protein